MTAAAVAETVVAEGTKPVDQGGADAAAAAAAAAATGVSGEGAAAEGSDKGAAGDAGDKGDAGKGADGKGGDGKGTEGQPDWRAEMITGLDEKIIAKAQDKLGRFATRQDAVKALLAADSRISELTEEAKSRIKIPGKDATPEQRAEYRKALGVPEAIEGYNPHRPEGRQLNELEISLEKQFLADALANDMTPAQANAALKVYYDAQANVAKLADDAAKKHEAEAETELRALHGSDYTANIELLKRFAGETLGPQFSDIMTMRLDDGRPLIAHVPLVNLLIDVARERADGGSLVLGNTGHSVDVDKRINEIMGYLTGTSQQQADYKSGKFEKELNELMAAQARRQGAARR